MSPDISEKNIQISEPESGAGKPGRQYSILYLFWLMVLAGMGSIGIRENWPDYSGIVWLGVLLALIHSSVRQVICLVKKQELPFGENETFTRMLWIGCRSLGVFMLVVVILNPGHIVDVDWPYPFGNMLNPLTAPNPDVIAYTAGMSLAGLGVMFCLMPLWRFRKTLPFDLVIRRCLRPNSTGITVGASFSIGAGGSEFIRHPVWFLPGCPFVFEGFGEQPVWLGGWQPGSG